MNRAFRIVWSHVRNCFVVVGENAKARGKVSKSKKALAAAAAVASIATVSQPAIAQTLTLDSDQTTSDFERDDEANAFASYEINGTSPDFIFANVEAVIDANADAAYRGSLESNVGAGAVALEILDNNLSITINDVDRVGVINELEATARASSDTLDNEASAYSYAAAIATTPDLNLGDVILLEGVRADVISSAYSIAGQTDGYGEDVDVFSSADSAAFGVLTDNSLESLASAAEIIVRSTADAQAVWSGEDDSEVYSNDAYASARSLAAGVFVGEDVIDPKNGSVALSNSGTIDVVSDAIASGWASGRNGPVTDPVDRAVALSEAFGIFVDGDVRVRATGDMADIVNSGSISAIANAEALAGTTNNIDSSADDFGGDFAVAISSAVSVGGDVNNITNEGSLISESNATAISGFVNFASSDSRAVFVGGNVEGVLTNSEGALISATATSLARSGDLVSGEDTSADFAVSGATGVYIGGELAQGSVNNGSIIAQSASTADNLVYSIAISGSNFGSEGIPFDESFDDVLGEDQSFLDASVSNFGGGALTSAIYVGDDVGGNMVNTGTLSASATASSQALISFAVSGAAGVAIGGDLNGQINNSGLIQATASSTAKQSLDLGEDGSSDVAIAYAYGYVVEGNITNGIINSGTISGVASATTGTASDNASALLVAAASASAFGVVVGEDVSGGITNSGAILASATSDAYQASFGVGEDGDISGDAAIANASAVSVFGSLSDGFQNSGLVQATAIANLSIEGDASSDYPFAVARASGLYVDGGITGGVSNLSTGQIISIAQTTVDVDYVGDDSSADSYAVGIQVGSDDYPSTLVNGAASIDGGFTNAGLISALAEAAQEVRSSSYSYSLAARATAFGVDIDGTLSGGLTNESTGQIIASADAENSVIGSQYAFAYATAGGIRIDNDGEAATALFGGLENAGLIASQAVADNEFDTNFDSEEPVAVSVFGSPVTWLDGFARAESLTVEINGDVSGKFDNLANARLISRATATNDFQASGDSYLQAQTTSGYVGEIYFESEAQASGKVVDIGGALVGNFSNAGTISGLGIAVNTATISGGIAYGISNSSGDITVDGRISALAEADAEGVEIGGDLRGNLTNTGRVVTEAQADNTLLYQTSLTATSADAENNNARVENDIDASADASAYAFDIEGDITGSVSNTGLISALSIANNSAEISGDLAYVYGEDISDLDLRVDASADATSIGIHVSGDIAGTFTNSLTGDISTDARSSSMLTYTADSVAAYAGGESYDLDTDAEVSFVNSADATSIALDVVGSFGTAVTNNGNISAFAEAESVVALTGRLLEAYAGEDGQIEASLFIDSAAESYARGISSESDVLAGIVTGSGSNTSAAAVSDAQLNVTVDGYLAAAYGEDSYQFTELNIDISAYSESDARGIDVLGTLSGGLTNAGVISGYASATSGLTLSGSVAELNLNYGGGEDSEYDDLALDVVSVSFADARGVMIDGRNLDLVAPDAIDVFNGNLNNSGTIAGVAMATTSLDITVPTGEDFVSSDGENDIHVYSYAYASARGVQIAEGEDYNVGSLDPYFGGSLKGNVLNSGEISALARANTTLAIDGTLGSFDGFGGSDIDGGSYAIADARALDVSGDVTGSITNEAGGSISASAVAESTVTQVNNSEFGWTAKADADAFAIAVDIEGSVGIARDGTLSRGLVNSGSITAFSEATAQATDNRSNADAYSAGVYIRDRATTVENLTSISRIEAVALAASVNETDDSEANSEAYAVYVGQDLGAFNSAGTIAGAAVSVARSGDDEAGAEALAYGIYVGGSVGAFDGSNAIANRGNFTNSGAITAQAQATASGLVDDLGDPSTAAENAFAEAVAAAVDIRGSVEGTITNSGSMLATALATANNTDEESGADAQAVGLNMVGTVGVSGSTYSRGLVNSGSIQASATAVLDANEADEESGAYAAAWGAYFDTHVTTIENTLSSSLISASATSSLSKLESDGEAEDVSYARSYAVEVGGDLGKFFNAGGITATSVATSQATGEYAYASSYAYAYGVLVGGDVGGFGGTNQISGLGNFETSGNISAAASAKSTGILDDEGNLVTGSNAGDANTEAYAFAVTVEGSVAGTFSNSGTISATALATSIGLNDDNERTVEAQSYAVGVLVEGQIGSVRTGLQSELIYSGGFTNSGSISAVAVSYAESLSSNDQGEGADADAKAIGVSIGSSLVQDAEEFSTPSFSNSGANSLISATAIVTVKAGANADGDSEGAEAYAVFADSNIGVFTNEGRISASAAANAEVNGADSEANSGAHAYGVVVQGDIGGLDTLSIVGLGNLTNSGTVSANAVASSTGALDVEGNIVGVAFDANSHADAFGFDIEGAVTGLLSNAAGGVIEAFATTRSVGVGEDSVGDSANIHAHSRAQGLRVDGRVGTVTSAQNGDPIYSGGISNAGRISASAVASGEATTALDEEGDADVYAWARGVNVNGDVTSFENVGSLSSITASAQSDSVANVGYAYAVASARGVDIEGTVLNGFSNEGLIAASSSATSTSFGDSDSYGSVADSSVRGVAIVDTLLGTASNSGTISGVASASAGRIDVPTRSMQLDSDAEASASGFRVTDDLVGSFVNTAAGLVAATSMADAIGDVEVTASADAFALYVGDNLGYFDDEGDAAGGLENRGRIIAFAEATANSLADDAEASSRAVGVYVGGDSEYYQEGYDGEDITIIGNLGSNAVISGTAIAFAESFGTITGDSVSDAFASAAGINLGNGLLSHESLTNQGTISGAAQADSFGYISSIAGADSAAIDIEGSLGRLTSSGRLQSTAIANAETLLSGEDFVNASAVAESAVVYIGEDLGTTTLTGGLFASADASAAGESLEEGIAPTEADARAYAAGLIVEGTLGSFLLGSSASGSDNSLARIQAVATASALGTENSLENPDEFATGYAYASAVGLGASAIGTAEVHGQILASANAQSVGDSGAVGINTISAAGRSDAYARGVVAGYIGRLDVGSSGLIYADSVADAKSETATVSIANAVGVDSAVLGLIVNEGVISATSTVTGSVELGVMDGDSTAYGVYVGVGTGSGAGTVSINGEDVDARSLVINNVGNFVNGAGVISAHASLSLDSGEGSTASGQAEAWGVSIGTVSGGLYGEDLVVLNSGTIRGTTDAPETFSGPMSVTYTTNTAGSIRINSGTGTVVNLENALLDGHVDLGDYSADINLYNAGTLDTRMDQSYVSGDFVLTETGMLKIHAQRNEESMITDLTPNVDHGSLAFQDSAWVESGAKIRVKVDHAFEGEADHVFDGVSRLYGVLTDSSGEDLYIQGEDPATSIDVSDNYLAVNFTAAYGEDGGDLDLVVTETGLTTAENAVRSAKLDGMSGAGRLLDEMLKNPEAYKQGFHAINGNLHEYLYALGSSSDAKGVAEVVSQALPLISGGVAKATIGATRDALRVIDVRQDVLSGRASGDAGLEGDRGMWLKPFGSSATQSENDGIGYESKSSGIVIGADALYTPDTRLGVALVMSKGDVETESLAAQEADVDTQQVVFYGNTALDDRTDVSYYLGFGMSDVEGRRTGSLLTGTLRSSFDSRSVFAGFDLGRTFQISEKASFRPSIRADYVSVKDDAYTETGASNMALSVRSQTTDSLVVGIDGKFSYAISDATKFTARLGIGADTIDDRAQATASFARFPGSPSFLTEGAKSSSFLVNGGLGLVGRVSSNLEMSANLDFESGSDFKAQSFSVKARWSF